MALKSINYPSEVFTQENCHLFFGHMEDVAVYGFLGYQDHFGAVTQIQFKAILILWKEIFNVLNLH